MNILIPDSWLREHLKTKATPQQIKEYLSLCGPSVERIHTTLDEPVYDIEVTTNRVDSFSVRGIAREAATILPEFGVPATLIQTKTPSLADGKGKRLDITIINDATLCHRILAVKLENVKLGPSPAWLAKRLEQVGERSLNNAIDITNYAMWELGHPIHAFDADRLTKKKIVIREAKKGETLITLDGKKHALGGGEIVFDDGTGTIIDLPGIMGTENSVVTEKTKNVLLFIESSDPVKIRAASMGLAIRTQAAVINEKNPDPELAKTALERAIELFQDIAGAKIASEIVDIYPGKPTTNTVTVSQKQLDMYLGIHIEPKRVTTILQNLGCSVVYRHFREGGNLPSKETRIPDLAGDDNGRLYSVTPPTSRSTDIQIAEDVIEEVARIYGYHNITPRLPDTEPPMTQRDPQLLWEEEIKIRLRDWGFTELYTYSMISKELMETFHLDMNRAYHIANPLSNEWEYMRPNLLPSVLMAIKQNLGVAENLHLFELSMVYRFREKDLPEERPTLVVALTGEQFYPAKGLTQALFRLFGIPMPEDTATSPYAHVNRSLGLGKYGWVGEVEPQLLDTLAIKKRITVLELDVVGLVADAHPLHKYELPPKFPPVYEDISFVVPPKTHVGPLIMALKASDPLVANVSLLDTYQDTRTLHITYQSKEKNLTDADIRPIRGKLIRTANDQSEAKLKE